MSEKWIVIADYTDGLAAHSARILLEASGIPAVVAGDTPLEYGLDRVELFVRISDYAVALQVIEEVPAASEVLIPEWNCLCGETVDAGFHVCWSCGAEHPDS